MVEKALNDAGARSNNRVYAPLVVMWLMVVQRLHGATPLEDAVLELVQGLPASFWPRPCKRIRDWQEQAKPLSSNTGAYNQARQGLPLAVIQKSCDHVFDELMARMTPSGGAAARPVFLLDGSSVRMAHSPSLMERFPPGSNKHAEAHWPVMRVLVAHDLRTGLAMRPEWGAMYGPHAVGEQKLLETAVDRLPGGATVLGDSNFGVFSVAWTCDQKRHPVLLRLTHVRAQCLAGEPLSDGMDRQVVWIPSRHDRKSHPELPKDARVSGRLIVSRVQPGNGAEAFLLALFTTLPDCPQELLNLYGQRWNVETDLRTLKTQLHLDQLGCATPEMVAKEIEMSIAAYNLVRAMICLASQQSGSPPREYSFTKARRIVEIFAPKVAAATNQNDAKLQFDLMMHYLQQARRPRRCRSPYPRGVWGKGARFPDRKS